MKINLYYAEIKIDGEIKWSDNYGAFNLKDAKILAKADLIKRGLNEKLLKIKQTNKNEQ